MKSAERRKQMIEKGYKLAKQLGSIEVVSFMMVAVAAGCSKALVKSYLINQENMHKEILKLAREDKNQQLIEQARALKALQKKTKKS